MDNYNSQYDGDGIQIINPADLSILGSVKAGDIHDVDRAVTNALESFSSWSQKEPHERGKILFTAALRVREDQKNLATLLTREQGKPLKEALNEISGFARILEYYASVSGTLRGDYGKSKAYGHMIVSRRPLGVCAAIIPWNVPAILMGWKIGPALAAGNTMVLKPSQTAPLTCLALTKHLNSAGLPENVLNIVTGSGEVVGEAIAKHPDIKSLSFTGAVETGKHVASIAAPTFKRLILELGGSDAMIVCSDADIMQAAKGAVSGRFFNCGQTCTAIKRVFVDDQVKDRFLAGTKKIVEDLILGNGLEKDVDIGPMHTSNQRDKIISILEKTIDKDEGKILTGGTIPQSKEYSNGYFFSPTILTDVTSDSPVMTEEVFGPVLPVTSFNKFDEAIDMANNTRFGLGASVWTNNMNNITKAMDELEAGIIWINQHLRIPPEVPFGGIKASGTGRENGKYALEHYLEEKSVLIR